MIQNINTKEMKYLAIYVNIHEGFDCNISLYDTTTTNPIEVMKEVTKAFGAVNLSMVSEKANFHEQIDIYNGYYMAFLDISMEWSDSMRGDVIIIDASKLPKEFIICSDERGLTFIGTEDRCPSNVTRHGIKVYNENPVFKYEGLK